MKSVEDLTDREVILEIVKLLNAINNKKIAANLTGDIWITNYDDILNWKWIPNSPETTGLAWGLCIEVLDELNAVYGYATWQIEITETHVSYVKLEHGGGILDSMASTGRFAEALSRLALKGLRHLNALDKAGEGV